MSECKYCGGDCPNQEEYMCDGYSGDIDNLYGDGELIYEGATVWFTDPDNELSSGFYTVERINGEVYSLSNDDGAVEAYKHELEVRYE